MFNHPDESDSQLGPRLREAHDLSLLILTQETDKVAPVTGRAKEDRYRVTDGASVVIVGYGLTAKKAEVPALFGARVKNRGCDHLGAIEPDEMQVD